MKIINITTLLLVLMLGSPVAFSQFTGLHGDGILHNSGNANTSFWPQTDPDVGVAGAKGTGGRGGTWAFPAPGALRISDRTSADGQYNNRWNYNGIRGVRSAP